MIPILQNEAKVVGFMPDSLTCKVTEERNGIYELTMTYPVTGPLFPEIKVDRFIKAKPNDTSSNQLFRIYEITKPINGIVTINAEHVSYSLSHYPINNVSVSGNATIAINALLSNANSNLSKPHGFSVATSDITIVKDFAMGIGSVRSALGGVTGSILDLYGGEFEFDNYIIHLHRHRGTDTGVIVSYGKNLTDIKVTTSMEKCYTHLFPYCLKDETLTLISGHRIAVTNNSGIAERVLLKDFTSFFNNDEEITAATLLAKANAWLNENDINTPSINATVSFLHLWQSPEYTNVVALEKVSLCDYVTVRHSILGVDIKAQVIKTIYDSLGEKYEKIELGSAKANFVDTIKQTSEQLKEAMNLIDGSDTSGLKSAITEEYLKAIGDATNAITGNSGGYIVLNPSSNPQELLIMDTASKETTTKLWRWNLSGLGYSSNGYNGTYATAITMDGKINADFITTGTLTANIIKAGTLSSTDGSAFFNLETGVIQTGKANITGGTIQIGSDSYFTKISDGSLTQHHNNANGVVGGLVPTGTPSGGFSQTLYFNGKTANTKRVSIAYQNTSGSFDTLAEFAKDKARVVTPMDISVSLPNGSTTFVANNTLIQSDGISLSLMELDNLVPIIKGTTKIGKAITTESAIFSGLTHTRVDTPVNHGHYDGRIKVGLGVLTSHSTSLKFSDYSQFSATNKTSGSYSYYAVTELTSSTTIYMLTKAIDAQGIASVKVKFYANSYGKAYIKFVARDKNGKFLLNETIATPWNSEISCTTTVNLPYGTNDFFIGINPDTGYKDYWAGWRDVSLQANHQMCTGALEQSNSDGTINSRLDCFPSWGSAVACIRLSGPAGNSAILEFGQDSMWWGGNLLTNNSSERFKSNIAIYDDDALPLINSSRIYSYRYNGEDQNPRGKTKYGLIIERECPKEVIDNSENSISLYSMTSLAWKAIQELSVKINNLEEKYGNKNIRQT